MKDDFRELWGPERAAEVMGAKRYRAAIKREGGVCSVCIHREKTWELWHCRDTHNRQFPACERDKDLRKFTVDAAAVESFKGRRNGTQR